MLWFTASRRRRSVRLLAKVRSGPSRSKCVREADQFFIAVEDDGRGLSTNRILAAAIRKGMVTTEEAKHLKGMSVLSLIFKPGFSTANEITEHAGRGVGMDIVKTKVKELGGRIGIGAEHGRRTYSVLLPLRDSNVVAAA